jgi:hypothetical protein
MAQNEQNNGLQLQVASMDQFKELIFLQSETAPTDLVVKLPDGSEVVFQNYIVLAQAGAPPVITLEDGTAVPGQDIVSLIDNLNYDLIAPAAGDAGEAPNGGGAAFASLVLDPDDDIGHGPYSNHIDITDEVGFDQYRGYLTESSSLSDGGDSEIPVINVYDNNGDDYIEMYAKLVGDDASGFSPPFPFLPDPMVNRPVDSGPFDVVLETVGPSYGDWDGMSIYLRAGETITVTQDQSVAGEYFLGIDTDFNPLNGNNPIPIGTFGWEYVTSEGSISYTAVGDGVIFIGTGFPSVSSLGSPLGSVFTNISVNSSGTIGDADFVGGDENGVFYGGTGDEVFIGGGGNDIFNGGAGNDQFVFEDVALDGNDTIADFDFSAVPGADNDVINLDALFDSLVPGADEATRLSYVDVDTVTGVLTVDTGSGAIAGFSIDLGVAGQSETDLFNNGNLVVDQS